MERIRIITATICLNENSETKLNKDELAKFLKKKLKANDVTISKIEDFVLGN